MSLRSIRNIAFCGLLAGVTFFGAAAPAARADLTFDFNPPAFNGTTPTGSETLPSPFLQETFTQTATNTVQVAITVLFGPTLPEFVDSIRFNSSITPLTFTYVSGVAATSTATGSFGAAGGYGNIPGNFNIQFTYQTSNSPNASPTRLNGTFTTSVYSITGTGLTVSSFDTLSTGGTTDMLAATHIAGFGNGQSGAFQGKLQGIQSVPEPSSIALCAIGGCIGLLKRKVFRRAKS